MIKLRQLDSNQLGQVTDSLDEATFAVAGEIIQSVKSDGEDAIRKFAAQFDGMGNDAPMLIERKQLNASLENIDDDLRMLLERTKGRIARFANAQRECVKDLNLDIPGGSAGHRWFPLQTSGCYAPGGRYPLPSSVLMTAVTARVAGVRQVFVASPNPNEITLAAAAIADADGVVPIGGAQAIAAFAFGIAGKVPSCDVIVGPGNRFVTAAKSIVSRFTRIDMLAGPSELVVASAGDASPALVAADLLAQAEHDPDARPILITTASDFPVAVEEELNQQLTDLPTADVASQAVASGGYIIANDLDEVLSYCRQIAPEHLSVQGKEFESAADRFDMGAALFIGSQTAEVFGDYGAGPNHVLPTGGSARSKNGLSVLDFMRFQTRLRLDLAQPDLTQDARELGKVEGLIAHSRSAAMRLS